MADRAAVISVVFALTFLAFAGGAVTSHFNWLPGSLLNDAFRAADALYIQRSRYSSPYTTNLWQPAFHHGTGVTVHDPRRAMPGYTLYTMGNKQGAFLIDMQGTVVHEWHKDFTEIWADPAHLERMPPLDELIVWRRARIWPNGDVIAVYIGEGITPWGMGLAKLDKNSNLLWSYSGTVHHDVDIGEDGRIYALTHDYVHTPIPGLPRVKPPYLDDRIVILGPDGTELQSIGIIDAFIGSPYQDMLGTLPRSSIGDYLHTNAINVIEAAAADAVPFAKAGDILVSLRDTRTLAVIDPQTAKVVWARRGDWVGQHDPDILENGNMLIFDNMGRLGPGGGSRVVEFNPLTNKTVWQYNGTAKRPFFSALRSAQQRLDNGNTLITESDRGRLLEITADGEIVWEYVNPVRGGPENRYTPVLMWGKRVSMDFARFLDTSHN